MKDRQQTMQQAAETVVRLENFPASRIPQKIVVIYLVAGTLWIAFSDRLLLAMVSNYEQFVNLQTFKGWFYVGATGLLLYQLIRQNLRELTRYQEDLVANYEELESAYEELVAMEQELQDNFNTLQDQQRRLLETEERYRLVVEGSNDCIWDWDLRNQLLSFSRTKLLLGYEEDELPETYDAWASLVHPEDLENTELISQQHLDGKTPYFYSEYRMRNKWGEYRWIQSRGKAVWDAEGKPVRIAGSHVDVTEQKRLMREMYQMAYYDELTELPNRTLFYDHLKKIMGTHHRHQEQFGLLTMDLDDFRRINDTRGHPVGDQILVEVARRINEQLQDNEFVARSGGDEFYVLKPRLLSKDDLKGLAERILKAFEAPFGVDGYEYFISASAGIAIFPDHGTDRDTLLQHADVALSEAKTAGKNKFWFFDQTIRDRITNWMEKEKDLRYAIQRREFVLHYQPIMDVKGNIVGVEALIRWNHPQQGLLSPFFFMELAEETDLIHPIGAWVMESVCQTCRQWKMDGLPPLTVSVNLSSMQFRRTDLPDWISQMIHQYGVDPCQLVVEITETAAMDNLSHTKELLNRIRALGVRVALDDFGTGYSSLNYLRSLPMDILKIDKSFIQEMGNNPKETFIVRQIIDMAHQLQLTVTAEGVEERAQWEMLERYGCDHLQGYYFHRPMAEEKLREVLAKTTVHPLSEAEHQQIH
ncbi:putative bifunctional diguanylate cyclase/phosphodiesterase [Anoxynatronum buryatiense]|uniref:PAS domain S-box-containing protein/diguanylate cyclase (GGDEF) domain-containing protein n=1 Tax=Anoxynatronum buryatiense TaxID=489973 RepID=A0AA45WXE5_9CLOT|nr:GGDEF domain-containing phosphodiesterase [Anoxynatronum buryatiense]SMP62901.1 PAS domain S-box-containing protein/diguanylate cyclase (GGDEF) domain-containing protein [Anoxynatronum buryatiense]